MIMLKQSMWNLAAVAIALLVLSTSAWADIAGTIYKVDGNMLSAGPVSSFTGVINEGTFTAPSINFAVLEGQGASNPLSEFLNSGGASYGAILGINDVMSNVAVSNCAANNSCYSTLIDIVGWGTFVNGQSYTITHDDGVVMSIAGNPFINAPGPVSAQPDSAVFSGTTGTYQYEIFYMATNGNPEVLQSNVPVPDGGATLMLLGSALVGIETLRRKFRR
jgi:hypothetical protein